MSKNKLHFEFSIKADNMAFFMVRSCKVKDLLFEGTIYSPNYDLVIYFICSDLLKEEFCCNIKIDIQIQGIKHKCHYKLSTHFSPEKYFTRISGLFEDIKDTKILVDVYFDFKSTPVFIDTKDTENSVDGNSDSKSVPVPKDKKNTKIPHSFPKVFNIIPLELIEGDNIYCKGSICDESQMQNIFYSYSPIKYVYYISFSGTEEIIGPVEEKNLKNSSISQYYTSIFLISKKIDLKTNKLAFFVEINKEKEFFGIFPLADIQKKFETEYKNLTVNNQVFDSGINYPSGVIVFGRHKKYQ